MNPEDRLQQMLNRARGGDRVTESKWNEFATSARRSFRIQLFAAVGLAVVLLAAGAVGAISLLGDPGPNAAQTSDGCDSDVGPITESREFTPYDQRLTQPLSEEVAITDESGQAVTSSERRVDGLQLRWKILGAANSSYEYYFSQPLNRETWPEFLARGGIELDRDAVVAGDPHTADDVISQVGDRAVKVQVADYEGALVWADPRNNGERPHHLYWSDGTYNYALIAVRDPQRMVQLGRELVCGG